MKRIIVFATVYYPYYSGAEVAVKEISDRLPGYEWHVVTAKMKKDLPNVEIVGAVTVHRVGFGWPMLDKFLLPIFGLIKARELNRSHQFSVIWSLMASQASVAASFFKLLNPNIPLTLTLQEGDEEEYLRRYVFNIGWLYRLFVRPWHLLVFKKADSVTAISRYLADRARHNGVRVPISVVPNGVDLDRFKVSGVSRGDHKVVLITVGRMVIKNAVDDIIASLQYLPKNVEFWNVGTGADENKLRELAKKLGVSDRVIFMGSKDHSEVVDILGRADIFIRPSRSEGLGNSLLEAMAVGLPTIGTRVGGIPDFLVDGETGLFCRVNDPKSIAEQVMRLINDENLRNKLSVNGPKLIKQKYDWNIIAINMDSRGFSGTKPAMNVLIAAAIYPPDPGGPATHAKKYFEEFPNYGLRTRLAVFSKYLNLPVGIRHFVYFMKVLVEARSAEVIYAQDALSSGFPAYLASVLLGKRFLVRIGGDVLWERYADKFGDKTMKEFYGSSMGVGMKFNLIRRVICGASKVIVPTQILKEIYVDNYGVHPVSIAVIPNPFPKQTGVGPGVPVERAIFFASRLVKYKNLDMVLRALAKFNKNNLPLTFYILGDGPEKNNLERLARELELGSSVRIMGNVDQKTVLEIQSRSMFAIAPALTEFNPNYVLSCIAAGKPFVISRENGFPFRVPEQFQFDVRKEDDLVEKLLWITANYETAKKIVFGIDVACGWDCVLKKNEEIVKSL